MKSWTALAVITFLVSIILFGQVALCDLRWYQIVLSISFALLFGGICVWSILEMAMAYRFQENEPCDINIEIE